MLRWYVAKVKPKRERQVRAYLECFGVEVYAPEILAVRRGRKRVEPLFPSYVFVKTDPSSEQWPLVHWTRGLSYFLGNKSEPTPCPEGMMDTIQARVRQWNAGGWEAAFRAGDRVLLQSGPFKELEAIFQQYVPGRERCHVLISLMGRCISVTVNVTEISSGPLGRRFAESF